MTTRPWKKRTCSYFRCTLPVRFSIFRKHALRTFLSILEIELSLLTVWNVKQKFCSVLGIDSQIVRIDQKWGNLSLCFLFFWGHDGIISKEIALGGSVKYGCSKAFTYYVRFGCIVVAQTFSAVIRLQGSYVSNLSSRSNPKFAVISEQLHLMRPHRFWLSTLTSYTQDCRRGKMEILQ